MYNINGVSEKQVAYAGSLLEQFVSQREADIRTQQKMIDTYNERISNGDTRDYTPKIKMRAERIEKLQRQINAAMAITNAGELIDAIKYFRPALYN